MFCCLIGRPPKRLCRHFLKLIQICFFRQASPGNFDLHTAKQSRVSDRNSKFHKNKIYHNSKGYIRNDNSQYCFCKYRNHWLERPLVRAPMGALNYLANTQNITRLSAHPLERPWAVRKIYRYSILLGAK